MDKIIIECLAAYMLNFKRRVNTITYCENIITYRETFSY